MVVVWVVIVVAIVDSFPVVLVVTVVDIIGVVIEAVVVIIVIVDLLLLVVSFIVIDVLVAATGVVWNIFLVVVAVVSIVVCLVIKIAAEDVLAVKACSVVLAFSVAEVITLNSVVVFSIPAFENKSSVENLLRSLRRYTGVRRTATKSPKGIKTSKQTLI